MAGSRRGLGISHTQEQHGPPGTTMQHLLSALVQDQPGVLAHISGMLASRGFNIDSLAVAKCERPRMSRMIFVVNGDDNVLDQVRKQLEKIIPVVEVHDISTDDFVERELMLIKIAATPEKRAEISLLVEMFRWKIPGDMTAGGVPVLTAILGAAAIIFVLSVASRKTHSGPDRKRS